MSDAVRRPSHDDRVLPCLLLATGMGGACFLYNYLAFDGFTNDHFVHLSRAQQILFGDLPLADFVDPGLTLMYYASAAFQRMFGYTLLAEAALVFGGLALAAAVTCWTAARLTGSYLAAAAVTLLQILVLPRSYSYPKILLYALALFGISLYARSPGRTRALLLGTITAAAFLMRHDHGILIGATCVVAIALVNYPQGVASVRRGLSTYAIGACLLVAPFLVLVESTVGLVSYIRDGIAFSTREAVRTGLDSLPRFMLDRGAATAEGNAEAWLFYLPWGIAAAAIARVLVTRDARRAAVVVAAALLSVLTAATFLRSPLSARLADVWGALPIALAYALAPAPPRLGAPGAVAALVSIVTALSVGTVGRVPTILGTTGLSGGPDEVATRMRQVTRQLAARPADERARELRRPDEDRTFLTYLFACTTSSDRLLVFTFAPEIYYLTERGFAGGQVAFVSGYHDSEREQQITLERWRRQSVPFAMMVEDERRDMERSFPLVASELLRRYVTVLKVQADRAAGQPLLVMAERNRVASSAFGPGALPCFAGN